ncbi:undecaprenyl-diphosphate phosphatase [Falsihalocynthiibacter arcticus]|uniref:Undecaprenyl-diphosphatase n=1 Tax=Falsihalocynthiibacter arcticus TaxID=1579316 RepID=A0A126V054_9RHOB|nr:undecaprenyl-diphosphate phosphatase [Falsihalocynthiibacter arcticus]AML51079.1 undecaprenyl-diphosphatase [Falsihalocynthiibacter arcticus]
MSFYHLVLVAIIQGITEFLPVSSSGHLILLPNLLNLPDQGQAIDVAAHIGTLFAVILYFRTDVALAFRGFIPMLMGRLNAPGAKLCFLLAAATVPVVIIGLILKLTGLDDAMRSITVIGWTMLVFGIVLYVADQRGATTKADGDWNLRDAIIMGLWQAVALIPGTSRSGATITGARALGYNRQDGAKLSMLMSIPTIIASGTLAGLEVIKTADASVALDGAIVVVLSFVTALLALTLMMRLLRSTSFTPYVIYRIGLGLGLLWIAYT